MSYQDPCQFERSEDWGTRPKFDILKLVVWFNSIVGSS